MKTKWIRCPICSNKTHDRIRGDTVLEKLSFYYLKCKLECLMEEKQLRITVIKEPEA